MSSSVPIRDGQGKQNKPDRQRGGWYVAWSNGAGCLDQSEKGTPHMTVRAMNETGTMTLLDGTLPVRPFHPDGFIGSMLADGQQVRVAALACDDERVIALSLVGFDTSIGVVLARLWSSTAVPFESATTLQEEWSGPGELKRSS